MKKFTLTLLLLVLAIFSFGQFAPIGAQWHYSASGNGSAPTKSEYYHYKSEIDTIVAGQNCQKISVTYYKYDGTTSFLNSIFTYQIGDTVYYYNDIYAKFFPLYIFNVIAGDTLTFHTPIIPSNPNDTLWYSIVDSVTSFIVNGDTLQRVWTTEPNMDAFSFKGGYIELLGSPFLMLHQPQIIYPEWDGPMRCYSDKTYFFNFNNFDCDYRLTTGIPLIENPFELILFPNPTIDQINIYANIKRQFNFNIYNSIGQLVKSGKLELYETAIPIPTLTNGIYYIELSADNKKVQKKFVVSR